MDANKEQQTVGLLEEIILMQREKLFEHARKYIPQITEDDLLQPNDFPQLEHQPLFRYEEGILEGLLTAQMALRAFFRENP